MLPSEQVDSTRSSRPVARTVNVGHGSNLVGPMTPSLSGKTLVISGGSRGIGLAIALRAARDGANITLLAKTAEPHPRLPGTVYTAAETIEAAGGHALPIVGDVRNDDAIAEAVQQTVDRFGGIDVCVNNASAIDLRMTDALDMKRYDLMQDINCRGTFALSKACIPHLRRAENPHILTLSPPLNLAPHWVGKHLGYTIAKYGMSLCTIGFAEELRADGIAANSIWPRTLIATDAVKNTVGADLMPRSRNAEIVAEAAYAILTSPSRETTANLFIDEDVLRARGETDFARYAHSDRDDLALDIFLDA
jgi:citronellol/citronellal dehydrogenase